MGRTNVHRSETRRSARKYWLTFLYFVQSTSINISEQIDICDQLIWILINSKIWKEFYTTQETNVVHMSQLEQVALLQAPNCEKRHTTFSLCTINWSKFILFLPNCIFAQTSSSSEDKNMIQCFSFQVIMKSFTINWKLKIFNLLGRSFHD